MDRRSIHLSSSLLLVRLHDEGLVDVRDHTTSGNGGLDESVELLVTSDGEQQVSGSDSLHFEIFRGVSSELKDLSGEVLKDSSTVDGRGGSYSRVGTDSALEESVDSSNGELN